MTISKSVRKLEMVPVDNLTFDDRSKVSYTTLAQYSPVQADIMAQSRPSKPGGPKVSQKPKGRPIKSIEKTADLLLANEKKSKKGKGKEKEVLGDLAAGIDGKR